MVCHALHVTIHAREGTLPHAIMHISMSRTAGGSRGVWPDAASQGAIKGKAAAFSSTCACVARKASAPTAGWKPRVPQALQLAAAQWVDELMGRVGGVVGGSWEPTDHA